MATSCAEVCCMFNLGQLRIGKEKKIERRKIERTRMWAMPNVMATLPNIGGTLCSTPHSLADAH